MKKLMYFALALAVLGFVAGPVMVAAQGKAPGVVILKGAPMGGVKFDHAAHVKAAGGDAKCDTCHHASKPEKPAKAKQEKCQDCHTKVPTPQAGSAKQQELFEIPCNCRTGNPFGKMPGNGGGF